MKLSKIKSMRTVYFLQRKSTPNDQLKELGGMDLTFEQMDKLKTSKYEYNGAYWITETDNEIPIKSKIPLKLTPQLEITRKSGMIIYKNLDVKLE